MVDMLDAMQQLMTGDLEYFDPAFLNELGQCWDDTHPDLRQAEDNAWQGMIDFFENDGWGIDPWGINGTTDQGRYSVLSGGSCQIQSWFIQYVSTCLRLQVQSVALGCFQGFLGNSTG